MKRSYWPLATLQKGDEFTFPAEKVPQVKKAVENYRRIHNPKFKVKMEICGYYFDEIRLRRV